MSAKFHVRFNLKNDLPSDEIAKYLSEFEAYTSEYAEKLSVCMSNEISSLYRKRTLFVGDSITSDNLGYRKIVTKACALDAYDASVSGGTTESVLSGCVELIEGMKPEIVSIMLGANDSPYSTECGTGKVSINKYEENMRTIIECAKNTPILCCSLKSHL